MARFNMPQMVSRSQLSTIVVRGSMFQAMLTSEDDFEAYLEHQGMERTRWDNIDDAGATARCIAYVPGGLVAHRVTCTLIRHIFE